MNKISILFCSILSLGLVACGGDDGSSGISDSKVVGTLTASEVMDLCAELAETWPERTVDCGDGLTISVGIDPAECNADQPPATCTATVGNFRDCIEAFGALTDAEICSDTPPPAACAPIFTAECTG